MMTIFRDEDFSGLKLIGLCSVRLIIYAMQILHVL